MISEYVYYLAHTRKVYGTNDSEKIGILFARYMKHLPSDKEPGRMDGSSEFKVDDNQVIRIIVLNLPIKE